MVTGIMAEHSASIIFLFVRVHRDIIKVFYSHRRTNICSHIATELITH